MSDTIISALAIAILLVVLVRTRARALRAERKADEWRALLDRLLTSRKETTP